MNLTHTSVGDVAFVVDEHYAGDVVGVVEDGRFLLKHDLKDAVRQLLLLITHRSTRRDESGQSSRLTVRYPDLTC